MLKITFFFLWAKMLIWIQSKWRYSRDSLLHHFYFWSTRMLYVEISKGNLEIITLTSDLITIKPRMPVLYVNLTGIILIYFKIWFFKTIVTKNNKDFSVTSCSFSFSCWIIFFKRAWAFSCNKKFTNKYKSKLDVL